MFKKNYLFISLCLAFKLGFGQTSTNLKVKLNNPLNNATVQSMQTFTLKATVTNLGPDALSTSDSLAMYLVVNGDSIGFINGSNFENFKPLGTAGINVNDSFLLNLPFVFSSTYDNLTINFCAYFKPLNRQTKSIRDTVLTNNSGCAMVSIVPKTSKVQSVYTNSQLTINPNPINSVFKLNCDFDFTSIVIVDAMGRSERLAVNGMNVYDCSAFNSGIYTLIVSNGILTARSQLLIQK